jgi:competence protein ComEC
MRAILMGSLLILSSITASAAKTLDVYFIDVEGGQATLFVAPSGKSILVDAGWPDANGRDADRILAAARLAGVKQIDYLLVTHYHQDHVGGVPQLAARIPIRIFVDHGPSVENGKEAKDLLGAYVSSREGRKHIVPKPGAVIPIKGIRVRVITSAGREISEPLRGAGAPNPLCATSQPRETDTSENAQSVGILITYGRFRIIDLGDLTWNKELELVCPINKLGTVDVYLTTHHGMDLSGSPAIVHALQPRVAIMNNGAEKGGSIEAWQAIHTSPGLEDIWQLHFSNAGGKENNAPKRFIANLEEQGHWLKLAAEEDGEFTVTNSRTHESKTYKPR